MEAKLLLIPWLASVIYSSIPLFWFVIHPFARRWRKMQRSPYRVLLPLWVVIMVALAWISWPWREQRIYSTPLTWIPALVFFTLGLRTYGKMFSEFGARKLSGEAELRPDEHEQRVVTTGLHGRMRHPIYFAHLSNLAGCALGSGLVVPFALLAISAFFSFPLMIWLEERELDARFGRDFRDYKRAVPLLPRNFFFRASAAPSAKNEAGVIGERL